MAQFDEQDLQQPGEELGEELGTEPTNPTETPTNPQPEQRRTGDPKKPVSWKDDPEYRAYQSERDKLAAQAKRLEAIERQRQDEQQRLAWYEQQLEALQTQHLDEPQKIAYENQKLKRMLAAVQQERQVQEGRNRIFQRIEARFGALGVPREAYMNAQDADEAWDLAADYAIKNMPKQAAAKEAARVEKREANAVYLPGGSNATVDDEWESEARRLLKAKDSVGYARHILKQRYKE